MNGGTQVNSWGSVTCITAGGKKKKSHEALQADAVGSVGLCTAATAASAEKFLILIKGGADFRKQLPSV